MFPLAVNVLDNLPPQWLTHGGLQELGEQILKLAEDFSLTAGDQSCKNASVDVGGKKPD